MRLLPAAAALAASILSLSAATDDAPLRELVERMRGLESQLALIDRESALPVDRAALWAGAARGMVEAADPHGAYLTPDEVAIYGLGAEPQSVGLGLDWRLDAQGVLVTRIVPGSPAAGAGLHVGTRILRINGLDPLTAARRQVAEALARSGDPVELSVQAPGGGARTLSLRRTELDDYCLTLVAAPAPGVLLVRVGRFLPCAQDAPLTRTAQALGRALAAAPGLRAVVLDLRGCAGGNLQAAVECAAGWLPPGAAVVEQIGRDPARARSWRAEVPRLPDVPLVVLIDGGTASSAEVLAGALRTLRRVPVVGTPSLGKGSVQQLFLLPRGDALQLTVAHLRTPGGAGLDRPLAPDVLVPQEMEATWRAWADPAVPDVQAARAVELAQALAVGVAR